MRLGLINKFALVCAGSRGLGKSIAVELAQEGAQIVLYGRDRDAITRATEERSPFSLARGQAL